MYAKLDALAPTLPDLTCQHIDGVLDSLADAMGTLDYLPLDEAQIAWNILAELRDDDGPLERLRDMNGQLRRVAAYWRSVAKKLAAEIEGPKTEADWVNVVR